MHKFLDFIFLFLHLIVILFNLFGWLWKRTRKLHLIVLATTLFSWLVLGLKFGLGYCFLTDWQWEIKMKLGETNLPNSFIKYFFDQYTFLNLSAEFVDLITIVSILFVILITIYLNFIRKGNS